MAIFAAILFASSFLINCDGINSSKNNDPNNSITNSSTRSVDGVYTGSTNISGLELVAKLTINGNRWSASSQLGYESPEYQNGVVKGNDLYDDSGMIKIGYVSGNTASINGYPNMLKL